MDIDVSKVADIIRHVAATEVMPRFNNLQQSEIREKNPGDFVTVADEASEKAFTKLLQEVLPGALVVGEEAVAKDLSVLEKLKDDKPVWVIDPIDGTYNFSHGRSKFGILIALVQKGVTQYGWAFDAPGNRMAMTQKGAGAFLDGKRLKIECEATETEELILQGGGAQAWHFDPIRPLFKEVVNFRCSLHDFMNFIKGEANCIVHLNKATPWDHAAANLLAAEAGGYTALAPDGAPYDPTYYGTAFMLTTPDKKWWRELCPLLYPKLKSRIP
jgi:fructose-1,6-bisphosphatase/inositol monophosphatase family enzyme